MNTSRTTLPGRKGMGMEMGPDLRTPNCLFMYHAGLLQRLFWNKIMLFTCVYFFLIPLRIAEGTLGIIFQGWTPTNTIKYYI